MSTVAAIVFDYAVAVTPSDTVNDPAGPFTALLVDTAGTIKVTLYGGTGAAITLKVIAGQVVPFPVRRVWSTGTVTAVVFGLVSALVKQGS